MWRNSSSFRSLRSRHTGTAPGRGARCALQLLDLVAELLELPVPLLPEAFRLPDVRVQLVAVPAVLLSFGAARMEFVEDPAAFVGDRARLAVELVALCPVLIRSSVRFRPLAFELF